MALHPKTLAARIAQFILNKKGHDVLIMDLRKVTDMADFFVVCSADSDVQVKAIADSVTEGTDKLGAVQWHSEGISERQWILLDYVDVVVHVFHREARKFYNLEKLWADAKIEEIADEPKKPAVPRKIVVPKKKKAKAVS